MWSLPEINSLNGLYVREQPAPAATLSTGDLADCYRITRQARKTKTK